MKVLAQQRPDGFSRSKLLTVEQLKTLTFQEKKSLSIGEYEGQSLGNYGDGEWLFYLCDGAANLNISSQNLCFYSNDVAFSLVKNEWKLTDCYTVSEAARDCLWLRYQNGISVRTLKGELRAWKIFQKWWEITFDGMDLEQWILSPSKLTDYLHWIKRDFRGGQEKRTVSKAHQEVRLQPLYQLYKYRSLLRCGLPSPPFEGRTAANVVGTRKRYQQTAVIEEALWLQIIQTAWQVVNKSDKAIEIFADYWGDNRDKLESALTRDGKLPSKATISNRLTKYLLQHGYESYSRLESEIILFEAAAAILILALTGMRQSELAGLPVDCYREKYSDFATTQFKTSYLQGKTYKYSYLPEGELHQWLVPFVMKSVVDKVDKLNRHRRNRTARYLEQYQYDFQYRKLWIEASRARRSLFVLPGVNSSHKLSLRWDQLTIKRRIDRFMDYVSDFYETPDSVRMTPHMFRRTFARFVAISPLGSIEALRDQFGHHSGDVTEYYIQGDDSEMLNWIADDQSAFQQAVIETQLNSRQPKHGGLGDAMAAETHTARDFRTAKNLKSLKKQLGTGMEIQLNAHSVSVRPVDKGSCANNCRLNRVQCISCENCVITPAQLPFWEDQLRIMKACEKEGIVQGIDEVRKLVRQLKEGVRESAATAE